MTKRDGGMRRAECHSKDAEINSTFISHTSQFKWGVLVNFVIDVGKKN